MTGARTRDGATGPRSDTSDRPLQRRPDWLIIGAPRCGTTTLSAFLDQHPGAFLAPGKEINHFDRGPDSASARARYYALFDPALEHQRVGEATPTYLESVTASRRAARACPAARIAAICRDPVDRAYSHYWWRRQWGAEDRSFERAVEDELSGNARPDISYLAVGHYARHIDRWESAFSHDQVLVLLFDDLVRDPAGTFRTLCRHLRIDDQFVPDTPGIHVNTTHSLRSRRLWGMTRRWRVRHLQLGGPTHERPASVPGRLAVALDRWNSRTFVPPPMGQEVRDRLSATFHDSNEALARRLGRSLDWT